MSDINHTDSSGVSHSGPEHTMQHRDNETKVAKVYLSIFITLTVVFIFVFVTVWAFIRVQDSPELRKARHVSKPGFESLVKAHKLDVSFELGVDNRSLLKKERGLSDNYVWVDRSAGTVSIPVERAMEELSGAPVGSFAPPVEVAAPSPHGGPHDAHHGPGGHHDGPDHGPHEGPHAGPHHEGAPPLPVPPPPPTTLNATPPETALPEGVTKP